MHTVCSAKYNREHMGVIENLLLEFSVLLR